MNWLQKFMYGRHGVDQLSLTLMGCAIVLAIVQGFVHGPVYWILAILWLACFVLALFRMYSRNHEKRTAENQRFLTVVRPLTRLFSDWHARWRDRKVSRYFRCPKCKATLRVPRGKGKIQIKCPFCHTEFVKKT